MLNFVLDGTLYGWKTWKVRKNFFGMWSKVDFKHLVRLLKVSLDHLVITFMFNLFKQTLFLTLLGGRKMALYKLVHLLYTDTHGCQPFNKCHICRIVLVFTTSTYF